MRKGLVSFSSWLTCCLEENAKERKEKQVLCWAGHVETFLVVFQYDKLLLLLLLSVVFEV